MAPDGSYVGGEPEMTPQGGYVGGQPKMVPDGSYVGTGSSGKTTMCPDGSYVGGSNCRMTRTAITSGMTDAVSWRGGYRLNQQNTLTRRTSTGVVPESR